MAHELTRRLLAEADRCGCRKIHIDWQHRHPRLRAILNGKALIVVFSSTTSDSRYGWHKALADLRGSVRRAGGEPAPIRKKSWASGKRSHQRVAARRSTSIYRLPYPTHAPTPTRLSVDPWELLKKLTVAD